MWRRFIRSRGFILLIFTIVFSLGILGQVDTRMHIGGSDWDLDNLIYINVDEYILADPSQAIDQTKSATPTSLNVNTEEVEGLATLMTVESETAEINAGDIQAVSQEENEERIELVNEHDTVEEVKLASSVVDTSTENKLVETNTTQKVDLPVREETTPPAIAAPKVEEKKEVRPSVFVHKVHSGETLWDIASAYGITVDTILSANELLDPNRISVGQELHILSVKGVLHKVASGENLWEISERYGISIDEISRANDISDPSRLQPNAQLVIPGATRLKPRDVILVNGQLQKAFDWPVQGRISSPFGARWGKMHNGLDIAVPTGTHVKAAADGRISFAGWNGGYGILVIVDHGNGVETRYAHNSRLNVKVGQKVERGQVIAYSGNTGVSTGPHVHFEIRQRNTPVNPQTYLK